MFLTKGSLCYLDKLKVVQGFIKLKLKESNIHMMLLITISDAWTNLLCQTLEIFLSRPI